MMTRKKYLLVVVALFLTGSNFHAVAAKKVEYKADAEFTATCLGGSCGTKITVIKFKSGPKARGGDRETGITLCFDRGLNPVVVYQATTVQGGPHGNRYNVAVCSN